jgi:hypothetical protein
MQATHLENRRKHVQEDPTKKPSNLPHKPLNKFKRKEQGTSIVMREGGNPSFIHFNKRGHDDEHYWKLHPEKRPKQFDGKGKTYTVATVQQDLGFDSQDEVYITTVGVQVKYSLHASSNSNNESHGHE